MIILDLNERNELVAESKGTRDQFYKGINYIKGIKGASYDAETKKWILPRSMSIIKQLKANFLVGSQFDIYELAGVKAPRIPSAADIFLNEINGDITKFMNDFKVNTLNLILRDFQKLGVSTALYFLLKDNGFLIADDMGLGKTIQALAIINSLKQLGLINKVLVSCPKNVKFQWGHEIEEFSNMSYIVIDGYNKQKRLECYNEDKDIYIINHDLLINDDDYNFIKEISNDLVVIDEAHYFKTHTTQRTRALKTLTPKYRLALTGTPMQNKPDDTHSIYEFLIPEFLESWNKFKNKYVLMNYSRGYPIPEGYRNLFNLKKDISTRMIRRKTADVSSDLPKVYRKTYTLPMDELQRQRHLDLDMTIEETKEEINALRDKIIKNKRPSSKLEKELENLDGKAMGFMNIQMEISNDLRLLAQSDSKMVRDMGVTNHESAKTKKLKELVTSIMEYNEDFKIVIFSQFARMVLLIQEDLEKLDCVKKTAVIYGQLNEKQRDEQVQMFKNDKDCRIIIQSDAGAEGLNLQNASHLINFDLPWNPATLDQRNGRIIRIGSPWENVFITNLVSEDSVDIKVLEAIERKRAYFDKIVENTDDQERALKEFVKQIV